MPFLKQPFPSFREKNACEVPKEEGSETSGQEICPTDAWNRLSPALRISPAAGKEDKGDHGYRQWSLYLNKLLLYEAFRKWQSLGPSGLVYSHCKNSLSTGQSTMRASGQGGKWMSLPTHKSSETR